MDVMNENVSKGNAIKALAEIYKITTQEIMAMGDNNNDIEMIQVAGIGVAMGNAGEAVKAVADDVAVHHEEDGVAWALEKYVLSKGGK
ncbi:HAD-superfamily hydrolase, subfamily IIB like protein [Aduncisulcus paluster]|uniref:HAD-superfamily hydrolase, subfamily IIB like protein n=1 Tax=Aduncisulcus paluster TaxID=2918883 RepID=A0ABQ5K4P7_9EUKA|nr:HAD-superfamily hydrolase, subfamily IIB like protein [Aduncisulcus paluster]